MSFGALGAKATLALNLGAKLGSFVHDTGEGGFSRYHRQHGGDIIWQIASGYFGCRNPDGSFSPERFAEQANEPQVKMIEIKLSQGAALVPLGVPGSGEDQVLDDIALGTPAWLKMRAVCPCD